MNELREDASIVACMRCGIPCRVKGSSNPDARLLQHASTPRGFCPDCGATAFLRQAPVLSEVLSRVGPQALLMPAAREQFARLMRTGNADANPGELDWERIVANWDLPLPEDKPRWSRKKEAL